MDFTTNLLKELTETPGISGYETAIRQVVRKYMQDCGDISQDKIGSVICRKQGTFDNPKVMLAGHMDEIGFMVKQISPEGFIKFLPLGGWFDQVLLGQRVLVQTQKGDVIGVIGARPPHLISAEEREKVVKRKEMYIDEQLLKLKSSQWALSLEIQSYRERILLKWLVVQHTYLRHSMIVLGQL
jgi:endoglucanase